jgi:cell division protein FtsQ
MELPRVAAPSRRVVATALVAVAVAIPFGLWLRDSPIVAVDHVEVTGVSGSQASDIRQAIAGAAQGMSTLHVDPGKLRDAVRAYPIVRGISVHRHLLHTIDVSVEEFVPVGALAQGGHRVAVAADGTLLSGTLTQGLPQIPVGAPPGGTRLVERRALQLVALLAAAPAPLRARVRRVWMGAHGLTARLSHGPMLYFGPGTRLRVKWVAAARVLEDYTSRGATYLDLRVPERPAAGGVVQAEQPTPALAPAPTPTTPAPTATTAAVTPATTATTPENPQAGVQTTSATNPPAQVETSPSATPVAP